MVSIDPSAGESGFAACSSPALEACDAETWRD
jgi:hypothetical protein